MKKFALSGFVIVAFLFYSFHEKQEGSEVRVIAPTPQPTDSSSPAPTSTVSSGLSTPTPSPIASSGQYKNGSYTGSVADAFYGNIQVKAIVQNGKITDVQFLQYPNDRSTSIAINTQAMPFLKQEAIAAQSAQVDIVSGATDSSLAFQKSLQSALNLAK